MTVLVLLLAALPSWIFVTLYALEWRHIRHTPEARHLIAFTAVVGALATEQLVLEVFGRWAGHELFVTITVAAAAVLLWQRVTLLIRYQVLPRRRRRRARTTTT